MIFEALQESNQKGELLLIAGGYCRFHLRRDGQITILEIISQQRGAGKAMLTALRFKGATSILAKCPADLRSNIWYARRGFALESSAMTKSGRLVNVWRLRCEP